MHVMQRTRHRRGYEGISNQRMKETCSAIPDIGVRVRGLHMADIRCPECKWRMLLEDRQVRL